ARSGSPTAARCAPACARTSPAGTSASRRSFATGSAASRRWPCSPADAASTEARKRKTPPERGFVRSATFRSGACALLRGRLLGDGLARRLGHRLGRGLLRDRSGRGAGAAGGAGDAGARLAVAGDVALALGGLAVALAHLVLLENARFWQRF